MAWIVLMLVLGMLTSGSVAAQARSNQAVDEVDNKLSEMIKSLPGPFDVIIHFDHHPSIEEVSALGLERPETFETFDWVAASQVPKDTVYAVAMRPDVTFVELVGPPLIPTVMIGLDVAARAVKARRSTEFSPDTAEDRGLTGAGVNICILDTGVDDAPHGMTPGHESLLGKFVAGYNAITDAVEDPDDDNGHGTHVAGIALGTGGPTQTYRGIAPGAGLVDVKVLDARGLGNVTKIIKGIDFCIANKRAYNIRVINISIVTPTYHPDGTDALSMAVNAAVDAGLVASVCAGNDGPNFNTITSPGAAEKAIAVGALDDQRTIVRTDDTVADFSSRGLRKSDGDADIMDEFKPDVTAPGVNIMSAQFNTASGYVQIGRGCSLATAVVSGLIALMLQKNRALSPSQVKHILHNTAEQKGEVYDPLVDPKYDREYGWGEVDAFLATETVKSAAVGGTIMTTSKETLAVDFGAVACCVAITAITLVIVKVRRRKRIEVP